jgi:hypothetical protein
MDKSISQEAMSDKARGDGFGRAKGSEKTVGQNSVESILRNAFAVFG